MTDSRARRWAATSARVVIGTVLAVAAVIAVTLGIAAPWPTVSMQPAAVQATPAPSDSVAVCTGPLLALGRTVEDAGALSIAAPQDVVSGPALSGAATDTLSAPADAQPVVVSAPPRNRMRADLAASGSSSLADPDLRGFAASACTPPLLESWLVGGSSTTGANDLVVLSNPSDVAATVELTVFGVTGPVVPPGGRDRVVPPRTQVVVALSGLAPDEAAPVIRVTASGAPVRASLQSSLIRVLVPGGVDQVGVVATPTSRQVIPGISVVTESDGSNPATVVRLLSPTADTEATVSVSRVDDTAAATSSTVPLTAGVPSVLDLPGLAPGEYTVTVESPVPTVAAAWEATGFGEASDFAWYAAAPEIAAPSLFAVPTGPSPSLTIANAGSDATSVDVEDASGAAQTVDVPGGASVSVPVEAGGIYRLVPAAPVHAAVGFSAADALASFPVWSADAAAPSLTIYP
ncbi:DUF5719 family protein [Microbacterium sp. P04]|uniref:DUF5719 family protein n=1 Tax=Microbacterium sp. P04 TaxID=3366947 RepID=UPI0037466762